jgi:hypothetical protein
MALVFGGFIYSIKMQIPSTALTRLSGTGRGTGTAPLLGGSESSHMNRTSGKRPMLWSSTNGVQLKLELTAGLTPKELTTEGGT